MAEQFPRNATFDELLDVFTRTFESNPRNYAEYRRKATGYESTPLMDMGQGSPTYAYLKQALPEKVGSMQWFQDQARNIQSAQNSPKWRRNIAQDVMNAVENIPLGGWSERERVMYQQARADDLNVRTKTVDFNQVLNPRTMTPEAQKKGVMPEFVNIGDNARVRGAQAAGVVASDVATDGLRNIWWFLNAPQAVASMAALSALHHAQSGSEKTVRDRGIPQENVSMPMMKKRGYRLAATLPAVVAMSASIGNTSRKPGYKQVVPSDDDPRKTADPWQEALSRYFLGRTGRLLPYKEFAKERPDVSPDEYRRYKAYSFDQKTDLNPLDGDFNVLGALRGTTQGIHGPEVNFMGKSIPVGTGILPVAAGVIGTRMGAKKAMRRLLERETGGIDQLNKYKTTLKDMKDKQSRRVGIDEKPFKSAKEEQEFAKRVERLEMNTDEIDSKNQREVLRQALLYGSAGVTGTALLGQGIESIRREG